MDSFSLLVKVVVLNLDERKDRLSQVTEELQRLNLSFERFPAIKHETGWIGYNQSILQLLERYKEVENLFLVEDDCQFIGDLKHLSKAVKDLPQDWDALWLGSNLQAIHTEKAGGSLYRLRNGWSTHAVIMTKKFREWCLNTWDKQTVFDEFLRVTAQPERKCYIVYPMIAIQRASHSDIINRFADYGEVFKEAQKKFA